MRRLVRLACVIAALFSWAAFEIATDSVGVFVSAQTVGQDVGPGVAQIGSIQGTTSATCSVYRATGGAIVIAGTWVGTLQFESSVDGTNYLALPVTPQAGGAAVTSTAANGTWNFTNAGYNSQGGVRVRASAWTSGTATINCTTVGASYFLANGNTVTALGPLSTPLQLSAKISTYNGVATAGWGVPSIVAAGRSTAQTAAVASVATYTVGAADGSFEVSANVLATVSTSYSFDVTVAWTDESNTARTLKMQLITQGGNVISNGAALTNATGPGFNGLPMHIRCKAATAITIATSGTFTTVTYNVEGTIKQVF